MLDAEALRGAGEGVEMAYHPLVARVVPGTGPACRVAAVDSRLLGRCAGAAGVACWPARVTAPFTCPQRRIPGCAGRPQRRSAVPGRR